MRAPEAKYITTDMMRRGEAARGNARGRDKGPELDRIGSGAEGKLAHSHAPLRGGESQIEK